MYFQKKDIVIGETGTSSFGLVNVPFPKNGSCLTQTLWGSIGWATGATMGAVVSRSRDVKPGSSAYALLCLVDSARRQRGQGEEEDHLVYW
jgi:TPP-dependent 2-oxoacid decarboxylase